MVHLSSVPQAALHKLAWEGLPDFIYSQTSVRATGATRLMHMPAFDGSLLCRTKKCLLEHMLLMQTNTGDTRPERNASGLLGCVP